MRSTILEEGKRLDGRGLTDIARLPAKLVCSEDTRVSLVHAGETQSLTTATLGTNSTSRNLKA